MTKRNLEEAVRVFRENGSFLVFGHVNPDGDSLGSMCAIRLAALSLGKSALVVTPDPIPDLYKFLPGSEEIVTEVPSDRRFDAAFVVDCDGPGRLGSLEDAARSCRTIVEIDHHPGTDRISQVQIIDSNAASSGELVYEFLVAAGVQMTREICECLITAIVTDTGCFRFSNVKPSTLRVAAALIESGVSINKIVHRVYESRTLSSAKILGTALSTLATTDDGKIAYAWITLDQMAATGADGAETEGIVNYVRSIRGARVGILFREEPGNRIRISLRSSDGLDISQVARMFGGGGHRMASGCTVERPIQEAIDLVIGAVQKWMVS